MLGIYSNLRIIAYDLFFQLLVPSLRKLCNVFSMGTRVNDISRDLIKLVCWGGKAVDALSFTHQSNLWRRSN